MILKELVVKGICRFLKDPQINQLVVNKINDITSEELQSLHGIRTNAQDVLDDVNENMNSLEEERNDFKTAIANAVNTKNGKTNLTKDSDSSSFVAEIEDIETGKDVSAVTAVAGDVLTGKVIVDKNGSKITGTMANQGTKTASLNCGGSYTIPAGYHNGNGKVTANSLASQTSATATAGDILSGSTAYVNGSKITGNIPKRTSGRGDSCAYQDRGDNQYVSIYHIPTGYYYTPSGLSWPPEATISVSDLFSGIGLSAGKIVSGNTICGVAGTGGARMECISLGSYSIGDGAVKVYTPSIPSSAYCAILDAGDFRGPIMYWINWNNGWIFHDTFELNSSWRTITYAYNSKITNPSQLVIMLKNSTGRTVSCSYANIYYYH